MYESHVPKTNELITGNYYYGIEVRLRLGLGINWLRLGLELVCTDKWKS